ncbi:GPO family capsid scaffolding protein [Aeromonas jandaei]|uniref:GPO family capsid scaffolding protein n=1 Tax=Aeromonas jandaei TaxID=650 RepID=UPI003BA1E45D
MSSEATTGWVCIASSGPTVSGKEIKAEWLTQMADSYDPEYYTATMWPEHDRTEPLGHVAALKAAIENGVTKLFAILRPNLALIDLNKEGKLCFCSIEPRPNFVQSGKWYLAALGLTDSPDSVGTTHLKFSAHQDNIIYNPVRWTTSTEHNQFHALSSAVDTLSNNFERISHNLERYFSQVKENSPIKLERKNMDVHALLNDFKASMITSKDGFLDKDEGLALSSAVQQSSYFLSAIRFLNVFDPHAPLYDPIKPGLRTGRKYRARFDVKADPKSQTFDFSELDSSVVFDWRELAQMLAGLSQEQANEYLEKLALAAFADDVIRIGFYGEMAADETNPELYPNGEDVATGWHARARLADTTEERIVREPKVFDTAGGGDYADLDTMAYFLLDKMPQDYRNDPRLVVLVGGDLLRAHKKAYLKPGQVRDKSQQLKIADMPYISHQHMPGYFFAITFMENLRVVTMDLSHRFSSGEVKNTTSWAIRYNRGQSYSLGNNTAYVAFDNVTFKAEEE